MRRSTFSLLASTALSFVLSFLPPAHALRLVALPPVVPTERRRNVTQRPPAGKGQPTKKTVHTLSSARRKAKRKAKNRA